MIKVCSLDFLKKDKFETDIMTVDGRLLCSKDDKVTPEMILRLYFKEIYVIEALVEKETVAPPAVNLESEIVEALGAAKEINLDILDKSIPGQQYSADSISNDELEKSGPRSILSAEKDEDSIKGPRSMEPSVAASTSGPKAKPTDLSLSAEDAVAEAAKFEAEKEAIKNPALVFDEAQAARIVEHSLNLGKMLNFSPEELKELEQVAYYCNIGITEFKKSDLARKEFRKMKAYASQQKLQKEEIVPSKISDIVKFTATACKSSGLTVGAKVPLDNIVGITCYYEDLLAQNNSKDETLLKMLQLGGNHFNIFVLHKFIRMIRETNG